MKLPAIVVHILLVLILCSPGAAAQVREQTRRPVRDNAQPQTGSASIGGTIVTDTDAAGPLRRAIVTVISTDRAITKTAVTDDSGRFVVADLPAGRYSVAAAKSGWITVSYGAKGSDRVGSALTLTDGQRATISIRVPRGAVIAGVILDESGQSPTSATVSAVRFMTSGGERRPVRASPMRTISPDERGQYRIYGLPAGEYYILVSAGSGPFRPGSDLHLTSDVDVEQAMTAIQNGSGSAIADVPQRSVTIAPVYYPGVPSIAQATPVAVRAGEERTGVDFVMPYAASVRVDGTVSGVDGAPANNSVVTLVNADPNAFTLTFQAIRTTRTDANGRFSFHEVTPGSYLIRANGGAPAGWAQSDLDVQGEDLRGVSLAMQEGFTISGTIRFEGATEAPAVTNVRVSLTPQSGAIVISSSSSAPATADGHFTISGASPGRYRLSAYLPGSRVRWALRTATLGGQDALDSFVDVRQTVEDVSIVFTDQLTELSGHAAPGSTLIVFSTNQAHWYQQSRRVLTTRTATDGSYAITNVSPGEYYLAAVDDIEPGQWSDPVYLQGLTTASMKITIAEGEKKTVDLPANIR